MPGAFDDSFSDQFDHVSLMTTNRINEIFKGVGKFIRLADIGAADASGVRSHVVATLYQFGQQSGGSDYYDDVMQVVIPLSTQVQPAVSMLDRISTQAKATVERYLRVVGAELNLTANAPASAILDALKAEMLIAGVTVLPSGRFYSYLRDNFAYTSLPTSPTPTIAETWVTTSIV